MTTTKENMPATAASTTAAAEEENDDPVTEIEEEDKDATTTVKKRGRRIIDSDADEGGGEDDFQPPPKKKRARRTKQQMREAAEEAARAAKAAAHKTAEAVPVMSIRRGRVPRSKGTVAEIAPAEICVRSRPDRALSDHLYDAAHEVVELEKKIAELERANLVLATKVAAQAGEIQGMREATAAPKEAAAPTAAVLNPFIAELGNFFIAKAGMDAKKV